jgi:carboxyl-terminal processing protease
VRVTQFQEHTGENLAKALDELYKQNKQALKGLVLDLRNDPGGLLNGAVGVSAAFLPENALVVYTEGRTEDAKMKLTASKENYLRGAKDNDYLKHLPAGVKSVPIVVLINGGSASASEIVAGAMQDHKRAIIIGTQSFGKGSVQTVLPLGNGTAIKLTTARYFTPNGRSIQAKGITPDIVVEEATVNGVEKDAAFNLREADLDRHLVNGQEGKPEQAPLKLNAPKKEAPAKGEGKDEGKGTEREVISKNDYQLNQAVNLLKGLQILKNR